MDTVIRQYRASYCDENDAAADSYIANSEDCNDVDGSAYPGATETSGDGVGAIVMATTSTWKVVSRRVWKML